MYPIPAGQHRIEETIKRSRFITTLAHTPAEDDAKQFIGAIKNEFSDATHNCWAYIAGPPGDTARIGLSDDGEPHGTAGKPMMTVLLHSGVGEITAVVTRYFGGTKLGTGGLVRAYSGCVQNALSGLQITEKTDLITLSARFDYAKVTLVKQAIFSFGGKVVSEAYAADVSFSIDVPKNHEKNLIQRLIDITGGDIRF